MMNTRMSQYWGYWRNPLSHLYFIIYYYYFVDRFVNGHEPLLALELTKESRIDEAVNDAFINYYLVIYAMIMALELVKV